jgi:large subunit ribosomal protein L23
MERHPRDIILRPVVSEKSYGAMDANTFTFVVRPDANKIEIRKAIEAIYPEVKVAKVNTLNRQGKVVRSRRIRGAVGKKNDTKRAIVTLKEGTIDIFGS